MKGIIHNKAFSLPIVYGLYIPFGLLRQIATPLPFLKTRIQVNFG